jgi:phosphoglycolate phosphatase
MFKYALFDVDGTVTDPYYGITECVNYALSCKGISENDETKLRSFIGPPLRVTFAKYGFNPEECEELVAKYREVYNVSGIFKDTMYRGIDSVLKMLHEHGIIIGTASCKPTGSCKIVLEHIGVLKYFDDVTGASLDKSLDSKPEIIRVVLKKLGVSENELKDVVMIGDRDSDIFAAKENGIASIGACYGYGGKDELAAAGADFLVDSPLEIADIIFEREK